MSAVRTAGRLVRCYPPRWRDRYGDELAGLIVDMSDERRVPWRVRLDVLGGAGRERLRAAGLGDGRPDARVRGGLGLVLWAWALFVLGGAILGKTSEHWREALPVGTGSAPGAAYDCLVAVALGTSLLVAAGIVAALPGLVAFLRAGGRLPLRRAVVLTVAAGAATVGLVAWAHGVTAAQRDGHDLAYALAFLGWVLLCAACLLAWTAAAVRAARTLELPRSTLRLESWLAAAAAAAMLVMATATAVWWITVAHASPAALTGATGGGSALVPQLLVAAVLMAAGAALAIAGARQALLALPELTDA